MTRKRVPSTGLVPDEAAKVEDDAYEIGKRDGYEEAIQEIDLATGGDGEFKGSTIPGETVDVPEMKTRIAARLRDETQLKQCTICGFTIDTFFAAVKPTADFTTRGRAKSVPDEAAIRADEREKCAKIANEYGAPNRFSVSDCWKDNQSPAEVYATAACDVSESASSAIISACGTYRYRLERGAGRAVAFIMVNPSTADASNDDPTIRKCRGFAARFGCDRIIVGNKFAFRSTEVSGLRSARDPIGPDNDRHVEQILRDADVHVVAWGTLGKIPETLRARWREIVRIADRVGVRLCCIGVNADGHPRHPLMTSYNTFLAPWDAPWFAGRRPSPPSKEGE